MSEETTQDTKAAEKPFLQIVVFAGLAKAAAAQQMVSASKDRNNWGNLDERLSRPNTFNPSAFQNVNFF